MSSDNVNSLSSKILKGTKWYITMRWIFRGLGFISSAFLARLLVPEDFGLVATAMVIFGLLSLVTDFGVNWALLQNNKATDDHFHTAWTLRLMQSSIIASILAIFSTIIADFYGDERIAYICQIMAIGALIRGFENIGTVKLQKNMKFTKDFLYMVAPKIISTFTIIALAYYFRSYKALVLGSALHNTIMVISSYVVVDFKPKFCLGKMGEIWGFSKWILVQNFARHISLEGDIILLSYFSTPVNIGYYRWGTELSFMAITELQQPFNRALVPGFAMIKDDHSRLMSAFLNSLGMMAIVAVPIALGFGAVSQELVPIFLGGGDKWLSVVPLIEGLVFFAMCTSIYAISSNLLNITGYVKYVTYIYWIQAIITVVTIYPAYNMAGILGVAYSRALIGITMLIIVSLITANKCKISIHKIINVIWRPILAALVMFSILLNISDLWQIETWVLLITKILFGAVIYISLILLLWILTGKPKAAESIILETIKNKLSFKK